MWWVLNEAAVDSALLDALEQFKDQATNRLLLSALETQAQHNKEDKKTPAKMLPSTLRILVLYISGPEPPKLEWSG